MAIHGRQNPQFASPNSVKRLFGHFNASVEFCVPCELCKTKSQTVAFLISLSPLQKLPPFSHKPERNRISRLCRPAALHRWLHALSPPLRPQLPARSPIRPTSPQPI